jgi:hypothetical protein
MHCCGDETEPHLMVDWTLVSIDAVIIVAFVTFVTLVCKL